MDNFLTAAAPFILHMFRRQDKTVCAPKDVPAWLVPAICYTFRREEVFLETNSGKAADYLGGYTTIGEDESLQVQTHLRTRYKDLYWANEPYCSAVLGPACLVLLTAYRKRLSLISAEDLVHSPDPTSPPL